MNKAVFYIVLFYSTILSSYAQQVSNLVSNPSFEEIDSCYGQHSNIGDDVFEWSGCKGWSNPIASSSDLWCQNPVVGNITPPQTFLAYQYPRTGQNMAGILVNDGISFNYREYIQNELLEPLVAGKTYEISFYVSGTIYDCMINQFGVKFFEAKFQDSQALWLTELTPDVVNDVNQMVYDTTSWQHISMRYTANGTERFIVIGNFQDSLSMTYSLPCDTIFWGNLTLAGGYYLIEDVSVSLAPAIVEIPNVFTPNNDGVNDSWTPTIISGGDWKIDVVNRWGNLITTLNQNNPCWTNPQESDGVYFYRFYSKDLPNESRSGFLHLIR